MIPFCGPPAAAVACAGSVTEPIAGPARPAAVVSNVDRSPDDEEAGCDSSMDGIENIDMLCLLSFLSSLVAPFEAGALALPSTAVFAASFEDCDSKEFACRELDGAWLPFPPTAPPPPPAPPGALANWENRENWAAAPDEPAEPVMVSCPGVPPMPDPVVCMVCVVCMEPGPCCEKPAAGPPVLVMANAAIPPIPVLPPPLPPDRAVPGAPAPAPDAPPPDAPPPDAPPPEAPPPGADRFSAPPVAVRPGRAVS